ncbi:MAG: MerR family transcriptional regulator [Bacteroidetes bacterium]|nr:MAG: MerR family transcriptional regulator [Bacteroidota bacterium]
MSKTIWIDQNELKFLAESEYANDYPGLNSALNTPRFMISDLNIAPRDATYWDKKGILPELKTTKTTRRKYTLKQAVWIKLIQQLRSFDIGLGQIRIFKESLLKSEINSKNFIENEEVKNYLLELIKRDGNNELLERAKEDPSFWDIPDEDSFDIFEAMILTVILLRRDMSYILFSDGECLPYCIDKHDAFVREVDGFIDAMRAPHIVLSITDAISQLIVDWSRKDWLNDISIITKDEMKVLELLREEKTKEIQVFKRNGKLDRVIQTSSHSIESIHDFANYILKNGYQKITVNTKNGNPINYRNEVSIKLSNE